LVEVSAIVSKRSRRRSLIRGYFWQRAIEHTISQLSVFELPGYIGYLISC
jgi:hypothetical protein